MKKGIAVVLAAAMLLVVGLLSCGQVDPETLWAQSQENMAQAKSVRMDINLDMAFTVAEETTAMTMKTREACTQDPLAAQMDMTMDMGALGEVVTEMYLVKEGETYVSYMKLSGGLLEEDEDTQWTRTTLDAAELEQYNAVDNAQLYLEAMSDFQAVGNQTIGQYDTIRYDGKITGEDMSKVLSSVGDSFADMTDSLYDTDTLAAMFQGLDGVPMSIWLDKKTALPVRYEMDLASLVNELMNELLQTLSALTDESIPFQVDKAKVLVECRDYNAVAAITVPQEALDSAADVTADDLDDDYEDLDVTQDDQEAA